MEISAIVFEPRAIRRRTASILNESGRDFRCCISELSGNVVPWGASTKAGQAHSQPGPPRQFCADSHAALQLTIRNHELLDARALAPTPSCFITSAAGAPRSGPLLRFVEVAHDGFRVWFVLRALRRSWYSASEDSTVVDGSDCIFRVSLRAFACVNISDDLSEIALKT